MLTVVKILQTSVDRLNRRVVQFLRFGSKDTQESFSLAPYGIDSHPIKNMVAIYGKTAGKGDTVLIGFINRNAIAEVGELRMYSTDQDGIEKTYHWLKNDGTQEFGGNTKNLTRYQELETAFNQLRSDHNKLVQAFNTHSHATDGATPTPGAGVPVAESNADISGAKIDHLKTN